MNNSKKIIFILVLSISPLYGNGSEEPSRFSDCDERKIALNAREHAACFETVCQPNHNIETANNGDEQNVPNFAAQFSKLLEHDPSTSILTAKGQAAYRQLVTAINSGQQSDYNAIQLFTQRLFMNPQSANALSMEGMDTSLFSVPVPPTLSSTWEAVEILEVYLQAVCRDVLFSDYGTGLATDIDPVYGGSLTAHAAQVLQDFGKVFKGPRNNRGIVDTKVLFRGISSGDKVGPYVSQFLLMPQLPLFPAGCLGGVSKITGIKNLPLNVFTSYLTFPIASKREFGVSWSDFINIENGVIPKQYSIHDYDATNVRYMVNGRDLASYVHRDGPYEAYYQALNILATREFPISRVFPYANGVIKHEGPAHTMGGSDAYALVGGVMLEAFKAVWAQKWRCHRRFRPEAMAGLIHRVKVTGQNPYNLDNSIFNNHAGINVLDLVLYHNKQQATLPYDSIPLSEASTWLLAQMYPEGSPAHPAYPAGHATVGGACTTVMKAIFDDLTKIKDHFTPVKPDPAKPSQLIPLSGEGENQMTVGSELDKLASNIAMARDWAGVHWRADGDEGLLLGEQVAIHYLQDHARTYQEQGFTGYEFTKRDGKRIRVTASEVIGLN